MLRRLIGETLENRQVMTTTVFLDFGEGFTDGSLAMTAGEFRNTIQGPDLTKEGSPRIMTGTNLVFSSLESVVRDQAIDFDGAGGAGDSDDYDGSQLNRGTRAATLRTL